MSAEAFFEWYCVQHELVLHADSGQPFAEKKSGVDGRRVVVGPVNGPNATAYPRTSQDWARGHPHDRHNGACGEETCRLDRDGQVLMVVPVRVDASELDDLYSCTEPPGKLLDALRSRIAL